jgi:hypothetical protein
MATCDLINGFSLGCRDNTGGIRAIYILGTGSATYGTSISAPVAISGSENSGTPGITIDANTQEITQISGSGVWYKFELFRQTSNLTETITSTPENGTVFYDQALTAVFFKMKQAVRNQVNTLAQNPDLKIIVETNNGSDGSGGRFFLMGQNNGAQLLSGTGQTGTAFGDLNGYNLTFSGQEPFPASEIAADTSANNFEGVLQEAAGGFGFVVAEGPF